jgi:hypothetical protein
MKKIASLMIVSVLLIGLLTIVIKMESVKGATIVVPDNYPTIQAAINASSPGDTVYVKNGTYFENINLFYNLAPQGHKDCLTIVGEDREATIIDAQGGTGISFAENYNITLTSLTIRNGNAGIRGHMTDGGPQNIVIENCIIQNNNKGLDLWIDNPSNNIKIVSNIIKDNTVGIVGTMRNFRIYHNIFENNTVQVSIMPSHFNYWDDGSITSGGNYWSDYTTRYPDASEIDDSRIWNTPYVIDAANQDNYPLMGPWTVRGENVTVTPTSGVSLTFANVASEGITTVNETQSGPSPPAGFKIEGRYFDIQTTATYSGNITIRITYDDTNIMPWEEETLRLLRWNETSQQWEDITTYVDTESNVIYGETNHISMFGITAGPIPGDINIDGIVDISDAALIGAWWQQMVPPAPLEVDINGDGIVDISDAALVGGNWQQHV